MKIFITGATGFIGGSVAAALIEKGHQVSGLVRDEKKAEYLQKRGIEPVHGSLSDEKVLTGAANNADAIINAADADNRVVVETILNAIRGTNKTFIHTSGSSIVADASGGEPSDKIYTDETSFEPHREKADRIAIDSLVKDAAKDGVRSIVICPTMIYGRGRGFNPHSIQVPMLVRQARKDGAARYIGRDLNIWSNVHIYELAALYLLALEKAVAGDFYFAENGEAELKIIAEEIGRQLNLPAKSWTEAEAIAAFGREAAVFAFGSNSRVGSVKAHQNLGWQPGIDSILSSIKEEIQ